MPIISPSIDQGAKLAFEQTFFKLVQQTRSKLAASPAIRYVPSNSKVHNMTRLNKLELEEVSTRNPLKTMSDYELDNRMFRKRRFTKTVLIDAKHDINELLKDPTSDLMQQLVAAKNRVFDRVVAAAAVGDVLTGPADATMAASTTSAAADGVRTIDATGGMNYETITQLTQTFINNAFDIEQIQGTQILATGEENSALMNEEKFINNDYIGARPVERSVMDKAGLYDVVLFAGSETGGIEVSRPVLPEAGSTRTCMALAPDSIAVAVELGDFKVIQNPAYVNSYDLTIDLWINAMRTEGERVVAINTTF